MNNIYYLFKNTLMYDIIAFFRTSLLKHHLLHAY